MNAILSAKLINVTAAMLAGAALFMQAGASTAQAASRLVATVSLSTQRMQVQVDGQPAYEWKVSTARAGYVTPTGSFKPTRLHEMWYSRKYDNAPMPHSVFFTGGFAIHATYATGMLGRPASHGCVRLAPSNAKTLFNLVNRHGRAQTQISLHGAARDSSPRVARSQRSKPKTYAGGDIWGFGYSDAPAVVKPQRRYRSVASSATVGASPKVVYRNGQAYMYVGPKAAKQYWRKNAYSGGFSSY